MSNHMRKVEGAHAAPDDSEGTRGGGVHSGSTRGGGTPASPGRKKKVLPAAIALVVCLVIAVAGAAFLLSQYFGAQGQSNLADPLEATETSEEEEATDEDDTGLEENPVDFATLQAQYPELYAWITIPNTNVNYPIMRSATDDLYYLTHDIDGNYSYYGAIFTQSMNSTDFSDPVTVIYGHNTIDGTFFADLHDFEDEEFFDENEYLYIYTPGHILTYWIISAYKYDDRHIMNSFDFSDESVRLEYFASVLNPTSMLVNVREGATLDVDNRIVQLSTCPTEGSSSGFRYLVTGVLINDQETL